MKWTNRLLLFLFAASASAQTTFEARWIVYAQLGTGATSYAYLTCVDDGGGQPLNRDTGNLFCASQDRDHPDDPRWSVRRCDSEGCEFFYPMVIDSPTKIHFDSSRRGTYYVLWSNGNDATPAGASVILQRGPIEYPPAIVH